jgi:ribonucleoside-diphosphate reductase beta chain
LFLTHIFRFFTQGDIDVAGGYVRNYLPHFPQPEVRMMLAGFAAREALHIAAYSHLIETLGLPETTYNEFLSYQEMRDKHDYIRDISDQNSTLENTATHIAVFSAFTEGMQLFSSFIMLLNFPRNGLMKGMGQIVTWSIVDETMHAESMIKLFRTYIEENKQIWNDELKSRIYTIAEKMVDLEEKFIDLAFKMGDMRDLTSDDVKRYIRYIADRRLISLGLKGIFKVKKNPLPWVEEMINAPTHTNFFENRATDYAKGALTGNWSDVWAN